MGAGDALREMDGLGLIRSNPFIIIRYATPRLFLVCSWWTVVHAFIMVDRFDTDQDLSITYYSGDVVSTVNLPAVIAAHKRRKAENSLNILTVVLSKVCPPATAAA